MEGSLAASACPLAPAPGLLPELSCYSLPAGPVGSMSCSVHPLMSLLKEKMKSFCELPEPRPAPSATLHRPRGSLAPLFSCILVTLVLSPWLAVPWTDHPVYLLPHPWTPPALCILLKLICWLLASCLL